MTTTMSSRQTTKSAMAMIASASMRLAQIKNRQLKNKLWITRHWNGCKAQGGRNTVVLQKLIVACDLKDSEWQYRGVGFGVLCLRIPDTRKWSSVIYKSTTKFSGRLCCACSKVTTVGPYTSRRGRRGGARGLCKYFEHCIS